jgi:hypothetical protein
MSPLGICSHCSQCRYHPEDTRRLLQQGADRVMEQIKLSGWLIERQALQNNFK